MEKLTVLKNIVLIVLLVGVVFSVSFYAEPMKHKVLGMFQMQDESVLGASSSRAQEITSKVSSDIASHADMLKEQFLNIRFGDVVAVLFRAQQIPQDITTVVDFGREQIEHFTKSK